MRATIYIACLVVAIAGWWGASPVSAAESEVSIAVMPVRYSDIDGDVEKFRAHHWIKDGYAGGIKEFSMHHTGDDLEFSAEGHAILDENDLGFDMSLKRGDWFMDFDITNFRKWYDGTGGAYRFFNTFSASELDRELVMDMGKIEFETGIETEDGRGFSVLYEHESKEGAKSRLTWATVKEGTVSKKIAPSWSETEERVDAVALRAHGDAVGFKVRGEQRWEFVESENFRVERQLSTGTTASDLKVRHHEQKPEADLMTSFVGAERPLFGEKGLFATAYRFAHMDSMEFESIREFNRIGTLTNFSNPEQKLGARADNDYDAHTWVGSMLWNLWQNVSLGAKLRAEAIAREGSSSYPADAVPNSTGGSTPNGIIDRIDQSLNENKALRWGEQLSLRYTGLPRTALYTELEFEQGRVNMWEDRKSLDGPDAGDGTSSGEVFNRFTVTDIDRAVATIGGRTSPWEFLDLTTDVRYHRNNNDYDDQRETFNASGARSAFFDGQEIETHELSTRATFKPCKWFRPSLRYQLRDDDYSTRAEGERIVKSGMVSHSYTADVTLQPCAKLLTTLSFSRQLAEVSTPAESASYVYNATPAFTSDVDTWLATTQYAVCPNVVLTNEVLYSTADNFNDSVFMKVGLPLGAAFDRLDVTSGLQWAVNESTTIEANYGFYHYESNSYAEVSNYDAHVGWLEAKKRF